MHTQHALLQIENLGIVVRSDEEFSVRLSRDKLTNTGAAFFGLLGYAVESGARTNSDHRLETDLSPEIVDLNLETLMGNALLHYLQLSKFFETIELIQTEDTSVLNGKGIDSLLVVTVKSWGFRECIDSESTDQLQLGIEAHAVLKHKSTPIWERNEYYLDGKCYRLEELRAQEELLEQIVTGVVDNISGNMVNEICFP